MTHFFLASFINWRNNGAFWRILAHSGAFWRILAHSGAFWRNNGISRVMMAGLTINERILRAVSRYAPQASIEKISNDLSAEVPRRTLQRRLADMVKANQLIKIGSGRGVYYELPQKNVVVELKGVSAEGAVGSLEAEPYIPISADAERIKKHVRQPLQKRKPIGYNENFLLDYKPNRTFYLQKNMRVHLAEVGASSEHELPAGTYARNVLNRLLIDFSWNSSRLEGNTYSLLETERLLEIGEGAEGKAASEAQMILNHKDAIEFLVENAEDIGFNRYTFLNLHALLSNNLIDNPAAIGQLRNRGVAIGGAVFHPLEIPQLIDRYFEQILKSAKAINDPFEQAFFVMVQLPYLQPFEDVNKRVSRLAANIPFIKRNLCPLSFIDVPQRAYVDGVLGIYELNQIELLRDVFIWAYERSAARYSAVRRSLGEPDPFRLRYRHQLIEIISMVVKQRLTQKQAPTFIQNWANQHINQPDNDRFVEIVETELLNLQEGNIARFRIRPSEFTIWKEQWKK